jgi:undecaprenyl-diphosphatase
MNVFETVLLGLIQGLTEFIPISSSGHLVIAQTFLSGASEHLFLEFINIGTMLALLVYFRRKIVSILEDIFRKKQYTLARNILITAIPAGAVGFVLSDFIASTAFFASAVVVVCTLFIVGVVMVVLEKLPKASPVKQAESLSGWRALSIGLAQMCALIPGVSRSGATIIAGRLSGLSAAEAAEYSFLASLPIMAGVTLKVLLEDQTYLLDNLVPLVVGNTAAFISGLIAVGFLMQYLKKHSLAIFGWYRIGLAAVLAVVLLVQ